MRCPSCGSANGDQARFCSHCGARLPGAVARGERRTVTMLFADIQGSTAAAELMDPEDWAEIVNGAFAHLIAPVERYEGTLARLQGDAILAFFGAPVAHEDDPVRAVRAGLDIVAAFEGYQEEVRARTGAPIAIRVGINTGLVVVGEVGSDQRVEYTALGDAINVAARMEQTADPGTVRVTEYTADLLGGMFALADIGPVEVKGKGEPVRAQVVLGPAEVAGPARAATRLVGRAEERAALGGLLEKLAAGTGAVAALVGEAGIGKSRLVAALRADAEVGTVVATRAGAAGELAWLEGRSRSFDNVVPYATFADVLRRWWGIEDLPADAMWQRIEPAVAISLGRPEPDTAALLANLLGATLPAEHRSLLAGLPTPILHERTTGAVLAYLRAEATRRPMLLVLEDLHWGDALSLALTGQLLEMTADVPLALLLVMRPHRDDPSWRLLGAAPIATVLELAPLRERDTVELVEELLGPAVGAEVAQHVVDHANGNPLFVEELSRSVADGRLDHSAGVHVPATLNGLLTARLDMLDERSRLVAQVASVVGREFGLPAVAALVDDDRLPLDASVADLVRQGVLVELRAGPQARYGFRHALIQETAYATVLLRTRRDLHARAARHLEASQPDAVQEIARHLLGAGATDRAFPYLVDAGTKATRAMALADAIRLFGSALEAVPGEADPQLVMRAHDGLGEAYSLIPDLPHATAAFQRLLDFGRASGQPSIQVTALNRLGMAAAMHAGDLGQAEQHLAEARRIAESAGDTQGLAEYHINACVVASLQGRMELAVHHDEATASIGSTAASADIRLVGLWRRAVNLVLLTQYDEAETAVADAVAAAREQGNAEILAVLSAYAGGLLALRRGDVAGASAVLHEGLATLDRFASFHRPIVRALAAITTLDLGDPEGAIAEASAARRVAQQQQLASADGTAAACLARAYAECGLTEQIARLRADAVDSMRLPLGELQASTMWCQLGWMQLARGDYEQADADLAEGLAVSSTTSYWERPALLLGRAFAVVGAGGDGAGAARTLLDEVETYVAERDIRLHDAPIAWCAGLVAAAQGDLPGGMVTLERAERVANDQGRLLLERDIAAARATLARTAGRDGAAAEHRDRAQRQTTAIADSIADEDLRSAFLQRSMEVVV